MPFNLYRVSTISDVLWVAAKSDSKARAYAFNVIDYVEDPMVFRCRLVATDAPTLKLPGRVNQAQAAAIVNGTA